MSHSLGLSGDPSSAFARGRILAVGSGKGGVGTSTVAALLATAIAESGRRTLLVDAGARFGALHELLQVPSSPALGSLRRGGGLEAFAIPVSDAMSLVSPAPDDPPLPSAERRALAGHLVSLYAAYDVVIMDAGATVSSLLDACAHGAARVLIVAAGDRVGLTATFALVKLLHQRAPSVRLDVIGNRITQTTAEQLHAHLNGATVRFLSRTIPFAGVVPEDHDFGSALSAGLGVHEAAAGSMAAHAMQEIGARIVSEFGLQATTTHSVSPAPVARLR